MKKYYINGKKATSKEFHAQDRYNKEVFEKFQKIDKDNTVDFLKAMSKVGFLTQF